MYAAGHLQGSWHGAAGPGACPVCPFTDSTFRLSSYRFPEELEEAARVVHGPAHSAAQYDAELASLDQFRRDAEVAFDELFADLAYRRARIVAWSETEGVSVNGPE